MNILTSKQQAVSNKFATPGPKDFSDLDIKTAETGAPIIADSLGWVDCKLTEILSGGDHDVFIGEIVAGELNSGDPLLYFAGKYRDVAPLDE